MFDKNKKLLNIGDNVKIFTYTKGIILEIIKNGNEECACVKTKRGTNVVYSEEIRKV